MDGEEEDEQVIAEEVEAMKSVYENDCTILNSIPPHFHLSLKPRTADVSSHQFVEIVLEVHATPQYPKEPPSVAIVDCKGLDQHRQKHLLNHIQTKANELSPGLMLVALCEDYKFTFFNKPIYLFGRRYAKFFRLWFSIGVGFSLSLMLAVTLILFWELATALHLCGDSIKFRSIAAELLFGFPHLLSGLRLSLADAGYICISTVISVFVHEFGHALAATRWWNWLESSKQTGSSKSDNATARRNREFSISHNFVSAPCPFHDIYTVRNENLLQIFVGGLDSEISDEDLRQPFLQYGDVVSVKIPIGKGCGFVQLADRKNAEEAIQGLNGTVIGKQTVRLSWGRSPGNKHWRNNDSNGNHYGGQGYGGHGYGGHGYAARQNQDIAMQQPAAAIQGAS
ncbi:Polyadenylate-binding protein rbp47b [Lathyrus oleraceus]|uniref:Polyadenylate-binding protein rbp47b n=1 Tax=Pisum sativum TaxID=3888 RepID=A0A9D4WG25_PEA|nr:Polyadenylate-binding protein rbp47b [Pisum sativum]